MARAMSQQPLHLYLGGTRVPMRHSIPDGSGAVPVACGAFADITRTTVHLVHTTCEACQASEAYKAVSTERRLLGQHCPTCGGSGEVNGLTRGTVPCFDCRGAGYLRTCPECLGMRWHAEAATGKGWSCDYCHGKGRCAP